MNYKSLLFWVLLFKAILISFVIQFGKINLSPDEAQYWTWSQALDWGYYSKPPGIAWQIGLGSFIFGSSEFGVRFGSIIFSFFQAYAVYFLAIASGLKSKTSFYCALTMALCPIGIFGSLLATTDGGALFFWTLACIFMVEGLRESKPPNPTLIGLIIAFGALFKWTIFAFWIFFFLFRYLYFRSQPLSKVILGIGISFLGMLPSVWWNIRHDWATFRHVSTIVQGGNAHVIRGNFIEFIGSQFMLLSPILFLLFIFACWFLFKNRQFTSPAIVFCCLVSIGFLFPLMFMSLFQKIQGNWSVFAYPTAIILIGYYAFEKSSNKKWLIFGNVFSIILVGWLLISPTFIELIPFRLNPLKHNMGLSTINSILDHVSYDPTKDYLFSDKYQTTSQLSYYGPQQKRAYFLNLMGTRNNQFNFWPQIYDEKQSSSGFFVWIENAPHLDKERELKKDLYQTELKKYFRKVDYIGFYPLITNNNEVLKGMLIIKCENLYNYPDKSNLY